MVESCVVRRIAILTAVCWAVLAPAASAAPTIEFQGNIVLVEEVYRAVLSLPPDAEADATTAELVQEQLREFLHKAGYTLATVSARVKDDKILVRIDEGQLEKVVFFGRGTLKTLQMKLDFSLPHHVFNRPMLQRQIEKLRERHRIKDVSFKMVPSRATGRRSSRKSRSGAEEDEGECVPGGKYELHLFLSRGDWDTGMGFDLEYDFPDGFKVGGNYRGTSLLLRDDRWMTGGQVGVKLRTSLTDAEDHYLALSRAMLEGRLYTPALEGKGLRPYLWVRSDLASRQRGDLGAEIYYSESLEGSLNLAYELIPGMVLSAGGGVQGKYIFGIEKSRPESTLAPVSQARPFVLGRFDLIFNVAELRTDRRNRLVLDGRYTAKKNGSFGQIVLQGQKVVGFGWHDLWMRGRGCWLWGDVLFDDEEPVGGRYVRGVFGDWYFVKGVAGFTLEARFSLSRDLFKVGVFHDLALFGEQDRVTGGQDFRVANSFGPGFHALILDAFQLNLYYAVGFTSDGAFDNGLSASLEKVF